MEERKSHRQALEIACQEIRSLDPAEVARRSGAEYRVRDGNEEITLVFFGCLYTIRFPDIEITAVGDEALSLVAKVMILHYLIRADGTEPKNEWIPYKEIPGGMTYAGVFEKRVVDPLIRRFGKAPETFLEVGLAVGGEESSFGDVSFSIALFPRVSLTFIMWRGDEEFPPSVQVLFDRSIDRYLSLEDVVVLGEMATKRLLAAGS